MREYFRQEDEELRAATASLLGVHKLLIELHPRQSSFGIRRPPQVHAVGEPNRFERYAVEVAEESAEEVLVLADRIEREVKRIADEMNVPWRGADGAMRQDDPVLGSLTIRRWRYPFLRGVVESRLTKPLIQPLPEPVFQYLVTIPGLSDKLVRESHGHWGYHYHYLNSSEKRSDTLLTFDQSSPSKTPTLLWERHGEGSYKFKARAERWGAGKRKSIYSVCEPDSRRWPLTAFKMPSAAAQKVWPQ